MINPRKTERKTKMKDEALIATLSKTDISAEERLSALRTVKKKIDSGEIKREREGNFVNNHIHTCYSFSPYTPTSAVFYAWSAGLSTAGIMDHDSVGGTREFIEAGAIMGMPVTCGFECRVNVKGTALEGKRINNPDQISCAYVAMHGIPHGSIEKAETVLSEIRKNRNIRNRKMCGIITEITKPFGIDLDFDRDVLPISMAYEGGGVTERHILFALTGKIIEKYPDREKALDFLTDIIEKDISQKTRDKLLSASDYFYPYDVLGILKSSLVSRFYIDADDECMNIADFTRLADELGAISAYAYLGDVGESPTGDKKAQKFEDDYLPVLFDTLKELGFKAVTYMPSRNTKEQLATVIKYCRENAFFEISGEDINSPRQSFICPSLELPEYSHLRTSTYALIGHEISASRDRSLAMFSAEAVSKYPDLTDRINHYAAVGGMR